MATVNNNTPTLRFPMFKEGWDNIKLGEVTDISKLAGYEYTKHVVYKDTGKIIALRAMNIKNNGLNLTEVKYIDDSDFSKLSRSKLYIGDLMFTYIGANIGDVALINENDRFYLAPNVARIRSNSKLLNYLFVLQYFNIPSFLKQEIYSFIASSSQPALSMESIRKFKILLPSLPEQTKIATFLTTVDDKLLALKQKKSLLEQYKKGVMQKIFSQELRFKEDNENAFADWEEKKLREVCEVKKGKQLNKEELTETGEYPCINGGIKLSGYTDKFNSLENTITISEGGNSCGYINFFKVKFWSGGHNYSIEINNTEETDNDFLFQLLKHNEAEIMKLRVGSGLPNIQKKDLVAFSLVLPMLKEEQTKIATFLSTIDEKINECQAQITNTEVWKKGLLQGMFV